MSNTDSSKHVLRLGFAIAIGVIGPSGAIGGAISVLIPARLAEIDAATKSTSLGVVTLVGAVAAIIANVVFGGLSDATRTRFGARTPWIVIGAIASMGCMLALSFSHSFVSLLVWWTLFQMAANAIIVALTAVIPDRVPVERRGLISTFFGVGVLMAATLGSLVGAMFLTVPSKGMMVFAVLVLAFPLVFVIMAPEHSNLESGKTKITVGQFLRAFAMPRSAPDFYWALIGRLAISLGYYMITSYQLYILTDYIGLGTSGAARVIAENTVITLVTAGVGMLVAGPISDRVGKRKLPILIGAVLFMLAIASPLIMPTALGMNIFAALGGMGYGSYYAVDTAVMSEVLPNPETKAKDLGILNIANAGGQAIAPSVASIAVSAAFPVLFIIAIAAVLIGGLAIYPIKSIH